jgi:predicted membrane-bound mannosyltransferase
MMSKMETIIELSVFTVAIATIYRYKEKIKRWLLKEVKDEIREDKLETKRNSILYLITFIPENSVAIMRAYDEYKALGGNSYIDDVFYRWKAEYNKN